MKTTPTQTSEKKPAEEEDTAATPKEPEESSAGVSDQDRIDEAMAESFPASDPPSWNAGVKQEEDKLTEDSSDPDKE